VSDDELRALVDRSAIADVQAAYADGVTRRDWDAVAALFAPDAVVSLDLVDRPAQELHGGAALAAFVGPAIERFDLFEFVILNSLIALWPDGDRDAATARIFMCELRHAPGEGRSEAFGRYEDRYERGRDGTWRIAARRYRSMARFPAGDVFPLPD
jgi:ketosteroid isomerase-like protein